MPPVPHESPAPDPAPCGTDISLPHALLADLLSPALTLDDIAGRYDLSLSDLLLILAEPGPAHQLAAIHHLAIERTRLIAASNAPRAIAALSAVLEERPQPRSRSASSHPDVPTSEPEHAAETLPPLLHVRRLETIRRAATTLLSLQRLSVPLFQPFAPESVIPHHESPSRASSPHQNPERKRGPSASPISYDHTNHTPAPYAKQNEVPPSNAPAPSPSHPSSDTSQDDLEPAAQVSEQVNAGPQSAPPLPDFPDPDDSPLADSWPATSAEDPSDQFLVAASPTHEHWP